MTDVAMGIVIGALKGIPAMLDDIRKNKDLSEAEKKAYVERLAGEISEVGQAVAAYKFKDVTE